MFLGAARDQLVDNGASLVCPACEGKVHPAIAQVPGMAPDKPNTSLARLNLNVRTSSAATPCQVHTAAHRVSSPTHG